jgi:homoserine O-acetyltransferase
LSADLRQRIFPVLVEKKTFRLPELLLQSGVRLPDVQVGYETYGTLNAEGTNAVLICHFFSGTSHCAGRFHESDPEPGYWDAVIGPGKAIDTNRFFVVSSDVLSNVNTKIPHVVATGPSSIDPSTGRPYGSRFPVITIGDFVTVQKALVDSLGINHLHAVAGPSMGALQTLEWSVRYPNFMDRVMPVIAPGLSAEPYLISQLQQWCEPVLRDPNFQGGNYYGTGREPIEGLAQSFKLITFMAVHQEWALKLFGRRLAEDGDPAKDMNAHFAIDRYLDEVGRTRAQLTDANALLRIARANQLFSIEERKRNIRAKFLMIPSSSDLLMTPGMFKRGLQELLDLGVSVETFTLEGTGGHLDGLNSIGLASDAIRKFMEN